MWNEFFMLRYDNDSNDDDDDGGKGELNSWKWDHE